MGVKNALVLCQLDISLLLNVNYIINNDNVIVSVSASDQLDTVFIVVVLPHTGALSRCRARMGRGGHANVC